MLELIRTNDIVLIDVVRGLLESEQIPVFVADSYMSGIEGSIGAFPRRLLVPADWASRPDGSWSMPASGPSSAMPEPDASSEVSEDALLGGRVRLRQPRRGHRAGTDAVLLAALSGARPGDHVVDLGSASGAVGLMIAARVETARLLFIDRDETLVALARENIALNGLAHRARALCLDVFAEEEDGWMAIGEGADLVVTNPPYLDGGERASPDPGRRSAHVMTGGGLSAWIAASARLLKPRGRLALIHRADRLAPCLSSVESRFGGVTVLPVYPRHRAPAGRIVMSAVKGGAAPLSIAPGLVLHGPEGRFTAEAEALHNPFA